MLERTPLLIGLRGAKMLKAVVISADRDLGQTIRRDLLETSHVAGLWICERYPAQMDLARLLWSYVPDVVFVSTECLESAMRVAQQVREMMPHVSVIAVGPVCDGETLNVILEACVDQFLASPLQSDYLSGFLANLHQKMQAEGYRGPGVLVLPRRAATSTVHSRLLDSNEAGVL